MNSINQQQIEENTKNLDGGEAVAKSGNLSAKLLPAFSAQISKQVSQCLLDR